MILRSLASCWEASSLCASGPRWDQLAAEYGRRVQDLSVGFCNPDRSRVRHVDLLRTRQKTPNPTLTTNLGRGEAPGGADGGREEHEGLKSRKHCLRADVAADVEPHGPAASYHVPIVPAKSQSWPSFCRGTGEDPPTV